MACTLGVMPKRHDLAFHRGVTFDYTVFWRRRDSSGTYPVDVSSYDVRFIGYDIDGVELFDVEAASYSDDGRLDFTFDSTLFNQDELKTVSCGSYRVVARQATGEALLIDWEGTPKQSDTILSAIPNLDSGKVELLVEGDWRVDN